MQSTCQNEYVSTPRHLIPLFLSPKYTFDKTYCFLANSAYSEHPSTSKPGFLFLQIFCVFLFMAGACLFGTIVSNTNTVLTEIGREATELAGRMEGYQMLISSCRCVLVFKCK